MDSHSKTGKVYLRPHKAGKKWKPVWMSLFPPSSHGVGRLEIQDMGGGGGGGDHGAGVRRHHHQPHTDRKTKVVRLSELISVLRLPPNAEACPMENMSAFCVETQDKMIVLAALKDDCVEWVEKLCHSAFQRGGDSAANQLRMEENQIYASADEEFWVVVQKTDAATRCGLQGSHWLQVGREGLLLREIQNRSVVSEWPYELLRRYGKDKMALTIEAGRRSESGPGTFSFETPQAEKIFSLIQTTIKRKTNNSQEGERVMVTNIQAHSPLPQIPDTTNMAAILEKQLKINEREAAADLKPSAQEDLSGSSESVSAHPAPITLMPLPQVPTHSTLSRGPKGGHPEVVYADPADCIRSSPKPQPTMALYVDPASVLPLTPPMSRKADTSPSSSSTSHPCRDIDHPDGVYSEVYDKISPVQNKQVLTQTEGNTKCFAAKEPIYSEPMTQREEVSRKNESEPDPFAHLYAQVCKPTKSSPPSSSSDTIPSCSASSSSSSTTKAEDPLDDIIYENLGII